jgi:PAS domain S-box-containing protein
MENTRAHLAYLDPDFNFVQVNTTYAVGCGCRVDELIGRSHFELFPDDENRAIFERVRDTGKSAEFRAKPFMFPDDPGRGVTYWDWTLAPVKDQRSTCYVKRLQRRQRIEERAQEGLWVSDVEGRQRWSTRRWRMLGTRSTRSCDGGPRLSAEASQEISARIERRRRGVAEQYEQ